MRKSALLWTLIPCVALAVSCSDKTDDQAVAANNAAVGSESAAGGSGLEVTLEGRKLSGLSQSGITCEKALDKIVIHSGDDNSTDGFTIILTNSTPPKVEMLSIVTSDAVLVVGSEAAGNAGTATVDVSGKKYTITGEQWGLTCLTPPSRQRRNLPLQ